MFVPWLSSQLVDRVASLLDFSLDLPHYLFKYNNMRQTTTNFRIHVRWASIEVRDLREGVREIDQEAWSRGCLVADPTRLTQNGQVHPC